MRFIGASLERVEKMKAVDTMLMMKTEIATQQFAKYEDPVLSLCYLQQSNEIVIGFISGKIIFIDAITLQPKTETNINGQPVLNLKSHYLKNYIAVLNKRAVTIINLEIPNAVSKISLTFRHDVYSIQFLPSANDDIIFAVCCEGRIYIQKITKDEPHKLNNDRLLRIKHKGDVLCADYFIEQKFLAVGCSNKKITIYKLNNDYTDCMLICTLCAHINSVRCVQFDENSDKNKIVLASGSIDSTTILWTISIDDTGKINETNYLTTIFREHTRSVNTLFFNKPNHLTNSSFVTGSSDGTVKIWFLN
jgi:WD40 repeat protein